MQRDEYDGISTQFDYDGISSCKWMKMTLYQFNLIIYELQILTIGKTSKVATPRKAK
jgi:hypothetical protein